MLLPVQGPIVDTIRTEGYISRPCCDRRCLLAAIPSHSTGRKAYPHGKCKREDDSVFQSYKTSYSDESMNEQNAERFSAARYAVKAMGNVATLCVGAIRPAETYEGGKSVPAKQAPHERLANSLTNMLTRDAE